MTQKNNEPKSLINDDSIFQSPETTNTTQDRLKPVQKLPDEPPPKPEPETALVPKSRFEELLERSAQAIFDMSPFSEEEFKGFQGALMMLARSELKDCRPASIMRCAASIAMIGLSPIPELHQAYLIPFGKRGQSQKECTLIIGYRGRIERAMMSGVVREVICHPVHENDQFHYRETSDGVDFEWVPWYMRDAPVCEESGNPWTAWMRTTLADGSKQLFVLDPQEIEKAKKMSASATFSDSPWKVHTAAMIMKTCVHRGSKFWASNKQKHWIRLEQIEAGTLEIPNNISGEAPKLTEGSFTLGDD